MVILQWGRRVLNSDYEHTYFLYIGEKISTFIPQTGGTLTASIAYDEGSIWELYIYLPVSSTTGAYAIVTAKYNIYGSGRYPDTTNNLSVVLVNSSSRISGPITCDISTPTAIVNGDNLELSVTVTIGGSILSTVRGGFMHVSYRLINTSGKYF